MLHTKKSMVTAVNGILIKSATQCLDVLCQVWRKLNDFVFSQHLSVRECQLHSRVSKHSLLRKAVAKKEFVLLDLSKYSKSFIIIYD